MNQALGGSCTVPVGAWCVLGEHGLHLRGMVGDAASGRLLHANGSSASDHAVALGQQVAASLLEQGAGELLGL
jgi:hydroxymethylbilane synthase